ncbi:MAG: serine/threonine-protein kinase [Polyangiales bacterium]
MKRCPRCNARFEDDRVECAHDGATLVDGSDPMLGRTLADRYRLVQRIGAGGMGTVYRAQHLLLRRDVALKLLASELTRDPVMRERFLREAQATHMLRHPNIVEVFDVALDGRRVFLVMELLEGDSLAKWLGSGPLEVVRSLRFVRPVVAALARAHSLGVVHRDIKPENVFISQQDGGEFTVKVLDFGIAHLRHEARLTAPGEVFGTPEYLAPEIGLGEGCVPASDLYAVGVMLFEMLTGALPFDGDLARLIEQHRTAPPPSARARNPEVPEELDALVARLMRKDPAARAEGSAELLAELDAMIERLDPPHSVMRPRVERSTLPLAELPEDDDDHRKTVPRSMETPPSLATLRQHRASFEAAVAASYPDGPPARVGERLRALNTAMLALDTLESQRRAAVREMTDRMRLEQERREALQDAVAEGARGCELAEASLALAATRLAEARGREAAALNAIAMTWNDLGPPSPHPGAMDEGRAAQMEALGASAARWRAVRDEVAGARARHASADAALEAARGAAREASEALRALEDAERAGDEALRARAAEAAVEIATLYDLVRAHSDALVEDLREVPLARGLLSWIAPAARIA